MPATASNISLPSWNDGPARAAITGFVESVATPGSAAFIEPSARIAVFDNDGTLWSEQPLYTQAFFAIDRVKQLAADHPEWQEHEPFKSVLAGDPAGVLAAGLEGVVEVVAATHSGMTTEEFAVLAEEWITTARHPATGRAYTSMVYQPMLELLDYLRANRFKTFIVSGGGIEFMRPWSEGVFGIPPEQVIGSRGKLRFEMSGGRPVLRKLPEIDLIDDHDGKPVAIHEAIGHVPLMAFGNSDGDQQMLQWTVAGPGPRFAALVHHTDAVREWAYDRESPIGTLDSALDEANARGWTLIDMKRDWKAIFPEE